MKKWLSVILTLVAVLAFFFGIWLIGRMIHPSLNLDETALSRFVFVGIGLLIVFLVYLLTRQNKMWGSRHSPGGLHGHRCSSVVCCALLPVQWNRVVAPSVSQVALRPAIAIPMFFGYAFGPVVGFFTGAVGNMFGDALTGFGSFS